MVLLILAAGLPCAGQVVNASLTGTVKDTTGGVIPGAAVKVTNVSEGVTTSTVSDASGNYNFPSLPPANYTLSAEKSGFKTTVVPRITLEVYQKASMDVVLSVGALVQTVQVQGAASMVSTTSASIGTVINQQQTTDLPLDLRRTSELALLVTGITNTSGNSLTSSSGNGSGFNQTSFSAAGAPSSSNLVLIDGMLDRALNNGGFALDLPPEMVEEFSIQNNIYDAQYGIAAGAVMNMVSTSGTNQFHGSVWDYLRNRELDARNFFSLNNTNPITSAEIPGSARPAYQRNQFGFAFGGPIRKDKTFIFGSYEGLRNVQGESTLSVVPDAAEAQGNFNSWLTGNIVNLCGAGGPANLNYDSAQLFYPASESLYTCPASSALAGSQVLVGNPIPNNVLPSISPFAQKVLSLFPAPNYPAAFNSDNVNFINPASYTQQDDTFLVRVDEALSSQDKIFAHYMFGNSNQFYPGSFNPFNESQHYRGQNAALGWTHTFSPTLLADVRVGIMRGYLNLTCAECPWPPGNLASFGMQGVSASSPQFEHDPNIAFNNFATWGDGGYIPDVIPDMLEKYSASLTKIHGRHTIVAGVDTNFYQILGYSDPKQLNTAITFNGQYSGLAGETPDTGLISDLADLEVGGSYPNSAFWTENAFTGEFVGGGWFSGFAQDNFHVSSNLSLELGVRWEYRKQPHDRHDKIATIFPLANSYTAGDALLLTALPDAANDALCSESYYISATTGQCVVMTSAERRKYGFTGRKVPEASLGGGWDSFAPRLGVSWRPTHSDKFVVHAGAGLFYDLPETNQEVAYDNNNPVNTLSLEYTPATGAPPPLVNGAPTTISTAFVGSAAAANINSVYGQLSTSATYFTPPIWEWSATLESQFAPNWALEVGYIGNRGYHESDFFPPGNQAEPGVGDIQPRRVWPDFGPMTYNTYNAYSDYNALIVRLTKHLSQGFSMLLSYTYSKEMDTNGGDSSEITSHQDANHPDLDYSVGDIDVPQQMTISPIWQLPLGSGQHFLNRGGWANALAGGWEVTGILTFRSGLPMTVHTDTDFSNSGSAEPRPDRLCNGNGPHTLPQWFNSSCFSTTLLAQDLEIGTPRFGNAGRNILFGPGLNEQDLSFIKRTRLNERYSLEFRAEFFNIFNHPEFGNPNTIFDSGSFGTVTSTAPSGEPSRTIQFGLKLIY